MIVKKKWNLNTKLKIKNPIHIAKTNYTITNLNSINIFRYKTHYSNFYYQNLVTGVNKLVLLNNFKIQWLNYLYLYLYLYNINFYGINYFSSLLYLNGKVSNNVKLKNKNIFLLNYKYL